jgi:hypothetical protein
MVGISNFRGVGNSAFHSLGNFDFHPPAKYAFLPLGISTFHPLRKSAYHFHCWYNAPAESFFKTLKAEMYGHRAFWSRHEARTAIFEYIEVFYNRVRLHSSLGYRSPAEYERQSALDAA